ARLRAAGIPVVSTRLEPLRDSNPAWSVPWRMFLQWFGTAPGGILPHPFARGAPGVGLRSWFSLLNFKANHRKLVIADTPAPAGGRRLTALVMSANPHDGSSAHGNAGLLVHGETARDLLRSEQAVLDLSGHPDRLEDHLRTAQPAPPPPPADGPGRVEVQALTERPIRDSLVAHLDGTGPGDGIDVAQFYLSDRLVVEALVRAARRRVAIRLLLDPNRDAFGHEKTGVPNRPVAAELLARGGPSLAVRWYATHGEQFHTKLVLLRQPGRDTLLAGSANLTRRNLGDLNLETNLRVSGPPATPALAAARAYFERLWSNEGHPFTLDYAAYADPAWTRRWRYRFQEATGLGGF
ncbi:MAG: phospholipase D-like domain-containing protein, partial [Verrucomicrobiota bacterium]